MTTFHVATDGADGADGSASRPFRTVNRAAELAVAGRHGAGPCGRVPGVGAAAAWRAERHAAHHLPGRAR